MYDVLNMKLNKIYRFLQRNKYEIVKEFFNCSTTLNPFHHESHNLEVLHDLYIWYTTFVF